MLRSSLLSISLMFIIFCCANAQQNNILGKWYFDRFGGPHGEIAESQNIVKANQQNKGMALTFTKDNKVTKDLPDGTSSTVNYQLLANRKLIVLAGDTMRIMLLTSDILELYPITETRPALFLKRSKDGKSSMSAP
jgi:hypothetical protein